MVAALRRRLLHGQNFFYADPWGPISGAVSIYDDNKNLLAFAGLTGSAEAPVSTAPTSLSFGAVPIGTLSTAKTFKITNNSAGHINVTASPTAATTSSMTEPV